MSAITIRQMLNHSFVAELAEKAKVAIDCGCNHGGFAKWLSENTQAEVYGFEADPNLFANLPKLNRVSFYNLAVDGQCGKLTLSIGESCCSSTVYRESNELETVDVDAVSLDHFCDENEIQSIDFLKLDIEGSELNVLENMSETLLRNTTQITVEFHDFLNRSDRPRIKSIISRLEKLGFEYFCFSYYTYGDCLFVNRNRVNISSWQRIKICLFDKLVPAIKRKVMKTVS